MSPTLQRRDDGESSTLSPVLVVGIVIACATFGGVVLWLAWRRWHSRRLALSDDNESFSNEKASSGLPVGPRPALPNAFSRSKMTASIVLPMQREIPSGPYHPESALSPYLPPTRPARPLTTHSTSRNTFAPNRATMTEHEILDYHLSQGDMPVAFAPISLRPPSTLGKPGHRSYMSVNDSVTANILNYVESEPRYASGSTVSSLPWHNHPKYTLSAGPQSLTPTSVRHSRFSSMAASIRFPGGSPPTSPARSIFTFGKTTQRPISRLPAPTAENQRVVKIGTFQPLLPDELVIAENEVVTVVQSYDDGWAIVARVHLGMLEMGAVPEWVFGIPEGEMEELATMRPMRSTSLGVQVDLRVLEPVNGKTGVSYRDSTISWANF